MGEIHYLRLFSFRNSYTALTHEPNQKNPSLKHEFSLERIVGGSSGGLGIDQVDRNVNASKNQVRMGQPLSYNSPRRKRQQNDVSVNTTHMSTRNLANTSRLGAPTMSPGNKGNSPMRNLLPNNQSNAGKEFVLEELAGGDVDDSDDLDAGITGSNKGKTPIPKEQLPEVLAGTLDHIVGQLDMVTRTLAILDKRLSLQEDLMAKHVFGQGEDKTE